MSNILVGCPSFFVAVFGAYGNTFVLINSEDLIKYSNSLITDLTRISYIGNNSIENLEIKLPVDKNTLDMIYYFYKYGEWKNPYFYKNKMSVDLSDKQITKFENICDFLNLPNNYSNEQEDNSTDEEDFDKYSAMFDTYTSDEDDIYPSDYEDEMNIEPGCYCRLGCGLCA